MEKQLGQYKIVYKAPLPEAEPEVWFCSAEDDQHAIEQFNDELSNHGMQIIAVHSSEDEDY